MSLLSLLDFQRVHMCQKYNILKKRSVMTTELLRSIFHLKRVHSIVPDQCLARTLKDKLARLNLQPALTELTRLYKAHSHADPGIPHTCSIDTPSTTPLSSSSSSTDSHPPFRGTAHHVASHDRLSLRGEANFIELVRSGACRSAIPDTGAMINLLKCIAYFEMGDSAIAREALQLVPYYTPSMTVQQLAHTLAACGELSEQGTLVSTVPMLLAALHGNGRSPVLSSGGGHRRPDTPPPLLQGGEELVTLIEALHAARVKEQDIWTVLAQHCVRCMESLHGDQLLRVLEVFHTRKLSHCAEFLLAAEGYIASQVERHGAAFMTDEQLQLVVEYYTALGQPVVSLLSAGVSGFSDTLLEDGTVMSRSLGETARSSYASSSPAAGSATEHVMQDGLAGRGGGSHGTRAGESEQSNNHTPSGRVFVESVLRAVPRADLHTLRRLLYKCEHRGVMHESIMYAVTQRLVTLACVVSGAESREQSATTAVTRTPAENVNEEEEARAAHVSPHSLTTGRVDRSSAHSSHEKEEEEERVSLVAGAELRVVPLVCAMFQFAQPELFVPCGAALRRLLDALAPHVWMSDANNNDREHNVHAHDHHSSSCASRSDGAVSVPFAEAHAFRPAHDSSIAPLLTLVSSAVLLLPPPNHPRRLIHALLTTLRYRHDIASEVTAPRLPRFVAGMFALRDYGALSVLEYRLPVLTMALTNLPRRSQQLELAAALAELPGARTELVPTMLRNLIQTQPPHRWSSGTTNTNNHSNSKSNKNRSSTGGDCEESEGDGGGTSSHHDGSSSSSSSRLSVREVEWVLAMMQRSKVHDAAALAGVVGYLVTHMARVRARALVRHVQTLTQEMGVRDVEFYSRVTAHVLDRRPTNPGDGVTTHDLCVLLYCSTWVLKDVIRVVQQILSRLKVCVGQTSSQDVVLILYSLVKLGVVRHGELTQPLCSRLSHVLQRDGAAGGAHHRRCARARGGEASEWCTAAQLTSVWSSLRELRVRHEGLIRATVSILTANTRQQSMSEAQQNKEQSKDEEERKIVESDRVAGSATSRAADSTRSSMTLTDGQYITIVHAMVHIAVSREEEECRAPKLSLSDYARPVCDGAAGAASTLSTSPPCDAHASSDTRGRRQACAHLLGLSPAVECDVVERAGRLLSAFSGSSSGAHARAQLLQRILFTLCHLTHTSLTPSQWALCAVRAHELCGFFTTLQARSRTRTQHFHNSNNTNSKPGAAWLPLTTSSTRTRASVAASRADEEATCATAEVLWMLHQLAPPHTNTLTPTLPDTHSSSNTAAGYEAMVQQWPTSACVQDERRMWGLPPTLIRHVHARLRHLVLPDASLLLEHLRRSGLAAMLEQTAEVESEAETTAAVVQGDVTGREEEGSEKGSGSDGATAMRRRGRRKKSAMVAARAESVSNGSTRKSGDVSLPDRGTRRRSSRSYEVML